MPVAVHVRCACIVDMTLGIWPSHLVMEYLDWVGCVFYTFISSCFIHRQVVLGINYEFFNGILRLVLLTRGSKQLFPT